MNVNWNDLDGWKFFCCAAAGFRNFSSVQMSISKYFLPFNLRDALDAVCEANWCLPGVTEIYLKYLRKYPDILRLHGIISFKTVGNLVSALTWWLATDSSVEANVMLLWFVGSVTAPQKIHLTPLYGQSIQFLNTNAQFVRCIYIIVVCLLLIFVRKLTALQRHRTVLT